MQVLELNCGTGYDAFQIAKLGVKVTATDVSHAMLAVAKEKYAHENIHYVSANLEEALPFNNATFDAVFSNFAGFNCLDKQQLIALNNEIARVLKPNGILTTIMLGKYCLIESIYFILKGNIQQAKRRRKPANAKLNSTQTVRTWCYTAKEIKQVFSNFGSTQTKPIGLFLPPSYLGNKVSKHPRLIKLLASLEMTLSASFFADFADHIYLSFRKKS